MCPSTTCARLETVNGVGMHIPLRHAGFVGRPRSDIDVITTIDPAMQRAAEEALQSVLDREGAARAAGQAAMVGMTPDGAVRDTRGVCNVEDGQGSCARRCH